MKKLFFYAAAALAMLASCQKAEISGSKSDVDDSQPAAIQFGIDAPSLTVTKTKAAVTEWENTEVFVYGLKQEGRASVTDKTVNALGSGMYNLTAPYIVGDNGYGYKATAVSGVKSILEVYKDAANEVPYFYEEGQTYDFYGYHLGGAIPGTVDNTTTTDQITIPVTIDGSQDVMYAYADKVYDIENGAYAMGTDDVYSAWAARRGVQPTLKFQHALSRFNIIVRGMNAKSENVTITGIEVNAQNAGNLVVVGDVASLGYTGTGSNVDLDLMTDPKGDAADTDAVADAGDADGNGVIGDGIYNNAKVVRNNTLPAGGTNACFMLAPNMTEVNFTVNSINNVHNTPLDPQPVTAKAVDLVQPGDGLLLDPADRTNLGATAFEAGKAYNIYINVYGPEEIVITAELTEWLEGGDIVYDPDIRPGTGENDIEPEKKAIAGTAQNMPLDMTVDEWNALPEAVRNSNPSFTDAQATFPWIGVTVLDAQGNKSPAGTYVVKVKKNGVAIDIDPLPNWPAGAAFDSETKEFTFTVNNPISWIGFELVAELHGDKAVDNPADYDVEVAYCHLVTEIQNQNNASLGANPTAEDYAAALPEWYVTKYPYDPANTTFPWIGITFDPLKKGTKIEFTITKEGNKIPFTDEVLSWGTLSEDKTVFTIVTKKHGVTYVGWEAVRELNLDPSINPADYDVHATVVE